MNISHIIIITDTQYTGEVILERNRLNVLFVANDFHNQLTLLFTAEFTVETNRTSVHCVTKVSVTPAICRNINVMYTATEDLMTIITVGSCLKVAVN